MDVLTYNFVVTNDLLIFIVEFKFFMTYHRIIDRVNMLKLYKIGEGNKCLENGYVIKCRCRLP